MPTRTFVPCRVSAGFFNSEYYVVLNVGSAYLVDRDSVKVNKIPENSTEVDGKVLAYIIEETPQDALVELPGEPVVGGLRTWVPKKDLEYVAAA